VTVFVNKGGITLTPAQLERRAQKHISRTWSKADIEKSIRTNDGAFTAFMEGFSADYKVTSDNNKFNSDVAEYKKAAARLNRPEAAVGRSAVFEDQETGEFDADGQPILETVLVLPAVEPVPAEVEVTTYNEDGTPTVAVVVNPVIEVDVAERAVAKVVVDTTPKPVKDFTR
jgi:hypothetical protein